MRRTKEDAQKTYDAILDAAVTLFAEKGAANASLEEVAEAAKVTRGAIYWHFKNKGEIFNALYERTYQPISDMILQDLKVGDKKPLEKLSNLCTELLLDLTKNAKKREGVKLFLVRCNYTGEFAKYREPHLARKEESLKLFSKYFEQAKKEENLPESADPALLTLAIRCYMKGIIFEYLSDPDSVHLEKNAKKLIKQFFKQFTSSDKT